MPKYVIEVELDGYDSIEEMEQACDEYLEDALHDAGFMSVSIEKQPNE